MPRVRWWPGHIRVIVFISGNMVSLREKLPLWDKGLLYSIRMIVGLDKANVLATALFEYETSV